MDELEEKIGRAVSEIEAALGERKGELDFEFEYAEEITAAGDRVGFARLGIAFLRAATPAASSSSNPVPMADKGRFNSPRRVRGHIYHLQSAMRNDARKYCKLQM